MPQRLYVVAFGWLSRLGSAARTLVPMQNYGLFIQANDRFRRTVGLLVELHLHPLDIGGIKRGHAPHFSPPRLEVVVLERDANDFPANAGNELSLVDFGGQQPDRPAGVPSRSRATGQRDHFLLLRGIECWFLARARSFIHGGFQATRPVPQPDLAYTFAGEFQQSGNLTNTHAAVQAQQSQGSNHRARGWERGLT